MNALYFLITESQKWLHNEVSLCWAMTFPNFRNLSAKMNHAEQSMVIFYQKNEQLRTTRIKCITK